GVDDGHLALGDLAPGLCQREPARPVRLGKALAAAGFRRPLHLELVAPQAGDVERAFAGEGHHHFAARLAKGTEEGKVALLQRPRLLLEFPPRCGERFLPGLVEALRDRPRAVILLRPERTSGMDEQDLRFGPGAAIEKDTGALLRHWKIRDAS